MRAQIARSRFLLHHRFFPPRVLRVFRHHFKRMQIDVSVRAISRAQSAPDAPILDDHFQRISPPNRAHRTAHHAQRIAALPAAGGHQVVIEPQSVAHQPRHPVMRIRARIHARIATRALLQIQHQQTLRFHQSLRQEIDRSARCVPSACAAHSPTAALPPLLPVLAAPSGKRSTICGNPRPKRAPLPRGPPLRVAAGRRLDREAQALLDHLGLDRPARGRGAGVPSGWW